MLTERLIADERMDDPSLDAATYHAVLGDLADVNRTTLAYRPTLSFLREAVGMQSRISVLDVGFGDGDMLRQIARWAKRRGVSAELTGIDLNPESRAAAEAHGSVGGIAYLTGDYAELAGQGFDCVISSLVAHHMSEAELVRFLRFMETEARLGWFVNDLHRHGVAYWCWPILCAAMGWHPIVRADGHTSIARGFRANEWRDLLERTGIREAAILRRFPFRLCVQRLR